MKRFLSWSPYAGKPKPVWHGSVVSFLRREGRDEVTAPGTHTIFELQIAVSAAEVES